MTVMDANVTTLNVVGIIDIKADLNVPLAGMKV
jgi:hypothetical protein